MAQRPSRLSFACTGTAMITIGPYRSLSHDFTVSMDETPMAETLAQVFRPLRHEFAPTNQTTEYRIETTADGWFLATDGSELIARVNDAGVLMDHLIWVINRRTVERWPGLLFHGGVVAAGPDQGVTIVGRSGAGKSTLVTQLIGEGLSYLSDELVPVESGGHVLAHPRSIGLKPGSWQLVEGLDTASTGSDARGQRFVDPELLSADVVERTLPRLIVILQGDPALGGPISANRVSCASALFEILQHCFAIGSLTERELELAKALVNAARPVTLSGGTPRERALFVVKQLRSGQDPENAIASVR